MRKICKCEKVYNIANMTLPPLPSFCRANRTKVLRLERDNRELERSLEVERQTNQRTSTEMEKMNRKLTATIHADKKEIARLKEVRTLSLSPFSVPPF